MTPAIVPANIFRRSFLSCLLLLTACNRAEEGQLQFAQTSDQGARASHRSSQPAAVDDEGDLAAYAAQCEAVLGPIPEISFDPAKPTPGCKLTKIPVFYNGRLLAFDDNHDDDALLAERRDANRYTCDFPSLGGDFACSVGSVLVQCENPDNPNVQWVSLGRGVARDNPSYDRFIGAGLIGANEITGEMCFFFASNPDPESPLVLPRLSGDADSGEDLEPWLPPREMPGSCVSCHPNNDPWVLTPWLQPSYMRPVLTQGNYPVDLAGFELDEVMAARFIRPTDPLHKTMLPTALGAGRTADTEEEIIGADGRLLRRQYRPIGSSYVHNETLGQVKQRTGQRPESYDIPFRERLRLSSHETSCAAGCHALANEYSETLARDALDLNVASKHLSTMMQDNPKVTRAWMPPHGGPLDLARDAFSRAEHTIAAITECPIPKQLHSEPEVEVLCAAAAVEIRWQYRNDFGNVPGRDDVRFDVGFSHDGQARGISESSELEGVSMEAGASDDVTVWTDVAADADQYIVRIPFEADQASLHVDLQPKRFCFEEPDRRPFAFAPPRRVEIDLASACGRR
ncbi:MAG: hypothetical protein OEZ06_04335 [Myxococcales bacterium]|nr:hypothetical protein [Myxococcales bacterium]